MENENKKGVIRNISTIKEGITNGREWKLYSIEILSGDELTKYSAFDTFGAKVNDAVTFTFVESINPKNVKYVNRNIKTMVVDNRVPTKLSQEESQFMAFLVEHSECSPMLTNEEFNTKWNFQFPRAVRGPLDYYGLYQQMCYAQEKLKQ